MPTSTAATGTEIIGEAVKGLPTEILVHEYSRVDLRLAWSMVPEDLPLLEPRVEHPQASSASGGILDS